MADQRIGTVVVDATTRTQALAVDASGRITVATIATSVTPGTAAGNLGKAEDAAHTTGDTGVYVLAVRADTPAVSGGTDGDYSSLIVGSDGRLWTRAILSANTGVDIGDVDVTSVIPGTGATNLGKAEDAAHTSGDVGVMSLAVRKDSAAALAGTDGDYIPLTTDADGYLRVKDPNAGAGTPTNPAWDITNLTTPVNLAAGAGGNADSADLPSKKLTQCVITSSVPYKAILGTMTDVTIVNKVVIMGGPGTTVYTPPHKDYITSPVAGAGVQGWRVALTNLDSTDTADVYVSFAYED